MRKPRQIIILLLTSLLVLQSVLAVAAPCDMPASGHGQMNMAMDSTDHSGHRMLAMDTDSGDGAAHCCSESYCSQNGCLSISALTNDDHGAAMLPKDHPHSPVQTTLLDPLPDSLLRPPSA